MASGGREKFTYDWYKDFLRGLGETYRLTTLREGKSIVDKSDEPLLILRHDIDVDLEAAVRMASLEKELGIRSTYFFMVTCPLYNVFSSRGAEQVRQILAAGHHFGLHFDCAAYQDISPDNLNDYVERERHLLEHFFGEGAVEAVSFHRPRSAPFEVRQVELERLPHSYESVFEEKFQYFADSKGNWARGNPFESRETLDRRSLHLCVHPIWWTMEPKTPWECLSGLVRRMGHRNDRYLSENCRVWAESIEGDVA